MAESAIEIFPVTASIGAEIRGLDLNAPWTPERVALLRGALNEHLVVFIHEAHLDDAAHLALSRALGEPLIHPFERALGRRDPIHVIVDKPESTPNRAGWHTDDSYLECPPAYGVLRCEVAANSGGDTAWASMIEAYEKLSPAMRHFLDPLQGFHATSGGLLDYVRENLPPDAFDRVIEEVGSGVEHPIVRTHPETGRRALFFEPNFVERIVELTEAEGAGLLHFLASRTSDISIQCRHRWKAGDVAIWDERMTQHIGAADHQGQLRVMRRCTVVGERPFH